MQILNLRSKITIETSPGVEVGVVFIRYDCQYNLVYFKYNLPTSKHSQTLSYHIKQSEISLSVLCIKSSVVAPLLSLYYKIFHRIPMHIPNLNTYMTIETSPGVKVGVVITISSKRLARRLVETDISIVQNIRGSVFASCLSLYCTIVHNIPQKN